MGIFTIVYQFADKNSTIMTFIPFLFYFLTAKSLVIPRIAEKYNPEAVTAAMIAANSFGETII